MVGLNLSDEIIKDFIYSVYRKEILSNLKSIVLTEEDRIKLQEKRDYMNRFSEKDLNEFRQWVMNKLSV
ncbi:hypothetical protein RHO15_08875 [Utexia brackfieldae]|uniref:hypothetical protein n=1 Tax=Utexia brackfieldae TaxID=3074108 RepID=UPI00370D852E